MKNNKFVFGTLTPIFICLVTFTLLPILLGLGLSFFDYDPLASSSPFVFLDNFKELFHDEVFAISLRNTFFAA